MNNIIKEINDSLLYLPITNELYDEYIKDSELLKDFNNRYSSEIRKVNFKYKYINIEKRSLIDIKKIVYLFYKKQEYPYRYNLYIINDKLLVIKCIINSNYKTNKKIEEGLISSISRPNMIDMLKRYSLFKNYNQLIKLKPLSNDIYIDIKGKNLNFLKEFINKFDDFIVFINNCGWFISNYHIKYYKLEWMNYKYDKINFLKDIKMIDLKDSITLTIEAKYNIKIEDGLPDILYHITNEKYIEKIKKIGLIPKSTNIIAAYPDRIYFTDNIERAKRLVNEFIGDIKYIIPIMTNKIYDIDFYKDSKSLAFGGIYTTNNIHPRAIDINNIIKID